MALAKLQLKQFAQYLKPRAPESHKGLFGHVLVVGGDYGFAGATRLAGEAALRVGAGLVSIATRPEHAINLHLTRPELMCHGVTSVKDLDPLLARATVVVLGPGLGQSNWAKKIVTQVLKSNKPLIIDADALNLLAKKPTSSTHWVLTPHPGEAARLLHTTNEIIQRDRVAAVLALQKKYKGVSILKGAGTLVATENEKPTVCTAGNPGMATAGMGDVLSGVIGGLAAQGMALAIAAKLGVLVHAKAGDLASKNGERGMIASDLFPYIQSLVNL